MLQEIQRLSYVGTPLGVVALTVILYDCLHRGLLPLAYPGHAEIVRQYVHSPCLRYT